MEKPQLSQLESLLAQRINSKHISRTYNLLMANNKANTNLVKEKWEKDLGTQIDDDHWSSLLADTQKRFINTRYRKSKNLRTSISLAGASEGDNKVKIKQKEFPHTWPSCRIYCDVSVLDLFQANVCANTGRHLK